MSDRRSSDGGAGLQFGATASSLSDVSNAINPATNFWNSTISVNGGHVTAGRTPNYTNTLGLDLDFLQPGTPLPNGATSAVLRVRGTSNEVIYTGMASLAIDVYVPDLVSSLAKDVVDDNGGEVVPGDILTYTLSFTNSGRDGATNVVLTDPIPAGTTYVPGSLEVLENGTGGATGSMTDASDGDIAEFDGTANALVFRLGTDDSAYDGGIGLADGGMIAPAGSARVRFKVRVDDDAAPGLKITNTAHVAHNAQTVPNFDAGGTAAAEVRLTNQADLSIAKHAGAAVAQPGQEIEYTLVVSNHGPGPANGATVRDIPGDGLTCTSVACDGDGTSGGAACPASLGIDGLLGSGLVIPVLPADSSVTLKVTCLLD